MKLRPGMQLYICSRSGLQGDGPLVDQLSRYSIPFTSTTFLTVSISLPTHFKRV